MCVCVCVCVVSCVCCVLYVFVKVAHRVHASVMRCLYMHLMFPLLLSILLRRSSFNTSSSLFFISLSELGTHRLRAPALLPPVVGDLNQDGFNDVVVITSDG